MAKGTGVNFELDELLHPAQAFAHPSEVLADPDLTLNEKRRRFALDTSVCRDDNFVDFVARNALEEFWDMQLLWTDAIDWTDCATQNVISSLELTRSLERNNIERLFDYGDCFFVAVGVGVERRNFLFGIDQRKSYRARFNLGM